MTKVFLDMDGVLIDLDKGLKAHGIVNDNSFYHKPNSEYTEAQKAMDAAVVKCFRSAGFFRNLPMMENAGELWLTAGKPVILTAKPKGISVEEADRCAQEKRESAEYWFGQLPDDRFICCLREEKKKYAKGNILVDDSKINCAEWTEAGGLAVLFSHMDQAVRDLRKLVGSYV